MSSMCSMSSLNHPPTQAKARVRWGRDGCPAGGLG
jgi:hypothetical protein